MRRWKTAGNTGSELNLEMVARPSFWPSGPTLGRRIGWLWTGDSADLESISWRGRLSIGEHLPTTFAAIFVSWLDVPFGLALGSFYPLEMQTPHFWSRTPHWSSG